MKIFMKDKILFILLSNLILFSLISFSFQVNADVTTYDVLINVEDTGSDDMHFGFNPAGNQIFWNKNNNRWYIIYAYDVGAIDIYMKYSYSDVGDITTWNNGGHITSDKLCDSWLDNEPVKSAYFAWVFDSENDLGHLVFVHDTTSNSMGLFYKNFTVEVTGALSFGDIRALFEPDTNVYMTVDICLSFSNIPIVGLFGKYRHDTITYERSFGLMPNSINGYEDSWNWVYFKPSASMILGSIIPTGDSSCVLVAQDIYLDAPLHIFSIAFGITSNSSGSGTVFSDNNILHVSTTQNQLFGSFGVSYNITHGMIHYTDLSTRDSFAFTFDFLTMTNSSEYQTQEDSGLYTEHRYAGGTIENNEFFATALSFADAQSPYINVTEYHNPLFDGYFNLSSSSVVVDNFPLISQTNNMMTTSRMCDDDGLSLIMTENDDFVAVTYFLAEGEYPSNDNGNNGNGERPDPFDWSNVKYILLIFILLSIIIFAVYVKHGGRK